MLLFFSPSLGAIGALLEAWSVSFLGGKTDNSSELVQQADGWERSLCGSVEHWDVIYCQKKKKIKYEAQVPRTGICVKLSLGKDVMW